MQWQWKGVKGAEKEGVREGVARGHF